MEPVEQEEVAVSVSEENDEMMRDFQNALNEEDDPAENGTQHSIEHENASDYQIDTESLETPLVDQSLLTLESMETDAEKHESADENIDDMEDKVEPDTEAVSEDELPSEAAAKVIILTTCVK